MDSYTYWYIYIHYMYILYAFALFVPDIIDVTFGSKTVEIIWFAVN